MVQANRKATKKRRGLRLAAALALLAAGFAAWRIYLWGQPVPQVFQRAGARAAARWNAGDGRVIEAEDLNGDGTYDRYQRRGKGAGRAFDRPWADPSNRYLIICLDGVPYSAMRELWDAGHFREFFPPVEMVSTFPSESEVALTAILGAPDAPGYENLYFDRRARQITGGVTVTLAQAVPYLKKLHYDEPAIFKGVHFFVPYKSYRADLGRMRRRFLESREPVFIAHISSADALYHVMRPEQVRPLLIEAEAVVRDLFLEAEGKLRVLLFSDHGNNMVPSRPAPVRAAVERAGFHWKTRLDGPRDVAVPQYGLINFAAIYCYPEAVRELAGVLAAVEGVDAVVYRDDGAPRRLRVLSSKGEARIEASKDTRFFMYEVVRGDPLGLLPVWEKLRQAERLDEAGFATALDLFNETLQGPQPDVLYRLWDWSPGYVANRSDLIVSLADGYYNGSGFFETIVRLESTHGGLSRASTLGFAMRTDARYERAVRYNELLK